METFIRTTNEFDMSKLTFGNMKLLDTGGRLIYLNYNGDPLIIQTPQMTAPFGLSSWSNEGDALKYSMELAFKGIATKPIEARFLALLNAFDKKVLENVLENSPVWLKKKFTSLEVIEALYTPSIKLPKDKNTGEVTDKYPPSFRMSVPYKDGKFMCDTYDVDGKDLDLHALIKDGSTKGSRVTAIMQCSGVWIAGGKFGCTWRVLQMRIQRSDALPPCAFTNDDEEDDGFDAPSIAKGALDKDDDFGGHEVEAIVANVDVTEEVKADVEADADAEADAEADADAEAEEIVVKEEVAEDKTTPKKKAAASKKK
jgi:hypothetical protein